MRYCPLKTVPRLRRPEERNPCPAAILKLISNEAACKENIKTTHKLNFGGESLR